MDELLRQEPDHVMHVRHHLIGTEHGRVYVAIKQCMICGRRVVEQPATDRRMVVRPGLSVMYHVGETTE